MSSLVFLGLYYPALSISVILVLCNLIFASAQPASLQAPITSKVIPYNHSASPLSSTLSFTIGPELSKVIPYNSSKLELALSSTPSFSVSNASLTFSKDILNGNTSKQEFKNSVVPHTIAVINGEKH